MKRTCLFAFALLGALGHARAEERKSEPVPPENLYFETDEFIRNPKYTVSVGVRRLSGVKTSMSGSGTIKQSGVKFDPTIDTSDPTLCDPRRVYNDGTVGIDTRWDYRYDSNGAPVFAMNGGVAANPKATPENGYIPADGKTNNWSTTYASQLTADGKIAMHAYEAKTLDNGPGVGQTAATDGMEVVISHDMSPREKRFSWTLMTGMSLNDIRSKLTANVTSDVTTYTDLYTVTPKQYPTSDADRTVTSPYTGGETVRVVLRSRDGAIVYQVDSNGNSTGTPTYVYVDNSHLLQLDPSRTVTVDAGNITNVINSYKLHGAFYSLRMGPTVSLAITERLRVAMSAGFALAYSGSTYTVRSDFIPPSEDATPFTVVEEGTDKHFLPGFYVDANMEYWLTENTGLYAGGVYQNNGTYTQRIDSETADYATRVDLSSMTGFRAGMNYRF